MNGAICCDTGPAVSRPFILYIAVADHTVGGMVALT